MSRGGQPSLAHACSSRTYRDPRARRYQRNAELLAAVVDTKADEDDSAAATSKLASAVRVGTGYLRQCPADSVGASADALASDATTVVASLRKAVAAERQGIVSDTRQHKRALAELYRDSQQ